MFRAFIGYIVGILSAIFTFGGIVSGDIAIVIVFDIIIFVGLMFGAHKYHIMKKDEYHRKIRGSAKR